jgi:hypothetical protein
MQGSGRSRRPMNTVTITCPEHSRARLRSWRRRTAICHKRGHGLLPPLRAPGPGVVEFKGSVCFYLELPGQSPADIAGVYTLTLTADRACTSLPTEARTRTYTATIVPGDRPSSFRGTLSDARFPSKCPAGHVPESCNRNALSIGTAGDDVGVGVSIVEQVGETTHLVVDAKAEGSLGPIGITAPLDGVFLYVPANRFWSLRGSAWTVPVLNAIHRVTNSRWSGVDSVMRSPTC